MEALGIDIKLLLAQTINFLLFLFIFKKFLYAPFTAYLKNEKNKEAEKERLLKDLQEKEAQLDKKEKEIIDDARAQALKMLKTAEDTAEKKKKDLLAKAHTEISEMKLKAKQDIQSEKEKLYDDLRAHVIQTSKTMTENVLRDFVDSKNQQVMFEHILKELKKSKAYEN